jgi:hypothetical protein
MEAVDEGVGVGLFYSTLTTTPSTTSPGIIAA